MTFVARQTYTFLATFGCATTLSAVAAGIPAAPDARTNSLTSPATNPFPPALFDRPWQRKAMVTGAGEHPESAKSNFLRLVGNPENDPRKGWTCDLSSDLMFKLGLDPTNTTFAELFRYVGGHRLGYRIVINNAPNGQSSPMWDAALENGMMVFAAHYDNTPNKRFDDPIGIKSAISVGGGGARGNVFTYGQSLEFHDALPFGWNGSFEDAAQSWANQVLAAKFARVLDVHPNYNIWDARQHLRQAANRWAAGWTEHQGYGWVDERVVVRSLEPSAPVSFTATISRDRHRVTFGWRNFLITDFAATVIAKNNGQVIYEGNGTNFTWVSDVSGDVTFRYGSKNRIGQASRRESNHQRLVQGLLRFDQNYSALVAGAPMPHEHVNDMARWSFIARATNWQCDVVVQPGNSYLDTVTNFPAGPVVAVRSNYAAIMDYAIEHRYHVLIAPEWTTPDGEWFHHKSELDRATAAGLLVVLPHQVVVDRTNKTLRPTPPRLFSAVSVGPAADEDRRASGHGLEFVDEAATNWVFGSANDPNSAAGVVAAKLAQLLETHPLYNAWDARQHLRQVSSHYAAGWQEKGGYGQPPKGPPPQVTKLDLAPPLGFAATVSGDGHTVTFSWENFQQSDFSDVVLRKEGGVELYHGAGTNFAWRSDTKGEASFTLQARGKSGAVSRIESYCRVLVAGLVAE